MRAAVVMSGGRGRRFWPLSRATKAKHLIRIVDGRTLIELTLERLAPLFEPDETLIVTQALQVEETRRAVGVFNGVRLLAEPVGRNTAACIAYASLYLKATLGDAVIAFLPADHLIRDVKTFQSVLSAGMEFVEKTGALLTIGIKPERPATGFGYIRRGAAVDSLGGFAFFEVAEFTEKPSTDVAERYFDSGDYLWNAGIFVFRASVILGEIDKYLPEMGREFKKCEGTFGTSREAACLDECYANIEDISVDFGIMEKTDIACVVPADIGWDDVGSWDSFARYMAKDETGNSVKGTHVGIGSHGCIIYSDRQVVATAGLNDITIVATDDAILVARRGRGEAIKDLTNRIEAEGLGDLL